jgi:hypothetical protein
MRHTPKAIRHFLDEHPQSGQTVAVFCPDNDIKTPTFYSRKKKYNNLPSVEPEGFCKTTPKRERVERSLRLASELQLSIIGLSVGEIAELILEIDRTHA